MGPPPRADRIVRQLRALEGPSSGAVSTTGDDRTLRREVLDRIRAEVPSDFYAFVLTDPLTAVGTSPLAEVPDLADLPRVIRLKYGTAPGRWTTLPDPGCTTLVAATGGALAESRQWREALRQHGVTDVLLCRFLDRHGMWGFLDLWRVGGTFADAEVAEVSAALPPVTTLLRGAAARCFVPGPAAARGRGAGVLLLADDLTPMAGTPQLRDWLAALLPPAAGVGAVPASALNAAAQLLAVEEGVDGHPPMGRVAVAPGVWLTVRADRLDTPVAGATIAVAYEVTSPADRTELFARAHALSPREREVVAAVATGLDTRATARRLGIGELTVQDHLKSVFSRTGAASRADLVARAAGT